MGLGADGGHRDERRAFFRLTRIVGRLWSAFEVFRHLVQRFDLTGPFEASVGVRRTAGAVLAGFGEAWLEPGKSLRPPPQCRDNHVLMRRELFELSNDWPQTVAFSIGSQVEDAFGSTSRRFVANRGSLKGKLDQRQCNWD